MRPRFYADEFIAMIQHLRTDCTIEVPREVFTELCVYNGLDHEIDGFIAMYVTGHGGFRIEILPKGVEK